MKILKAPFAIVVLIVAISTAICILMFLPSFLERNAGYRDVLRIELPNGVKCVAQVMNTSGRDRVRYDYWLLLQGDSEALLAYVKLLAMDEVDVAVVGGSGYMSGNRMKWWSPPSLSGKSGYRSFRKQHLGVPASEDSQFSMTRAELAGDKLYLLQVGDIKSLEGNMQNYPSLYKPWTW